MPAVRVNEGRGRTPCRQRRPRVCEGPTRPARSSRSWPTCRHQRRSLLNQPEVLGERDVPGQRARRSSSSRSRSSSRLAPLMRFLSARTRSVSALSDSDMIRRQQFTVLSCVALVLASCLAGCSSSAASTTLLTRPSMAGSSTRGRTSGTTAVRAVSAIVTVEELTAVATAPPGHGWTATTWRRSRRPRGSCGPSALRGRTSHQPVWLRPQASATSPPCISKVRHT